MSFDPYDKATNGVNDVNEFVGHVCDYCKAYATVVLNCKTCDMVQCMVCTNYLNEFSKVCICCLKDNNLVQHVLPSDTNLSSSTSSTDELWLSEEEDGMSPLTPLDYSSNYLNSFSTYTPPYSYSSYLRSPSPPPLDTVVMGSEKIGLTNLGNSCYINCILQIFLHTTYLWAALEQTFGRDHIVQEVRNAYCSFAKIGLTEQDDAICLLNFLLDKCSKYKVFWGLEWSTMYRCNDCMTVTKHTQDPDNIWIVYPAENKDGSSQAVADEHGYLYDKDLSVCIENQQTEEMSKNCDCCRNVTPFLKRIVLNSLPRFLFINLQRFANQHIVFYDEIELSSSKQNKSYELKGVVCHVGSQFSGHYTYYSRDEDGWTLYDDRKVSKVDNIFKVFGERRLNRSFVLLYYVESGYDTLVSLTSDKDEHSSDDASSLSVGSTGHSTRHSMRTRSSSRGAPSRSVSRSAKRSKSNSPTTDPVEPLPQAVSDLSLQDEASV